ncbi:MAG: glycosyltransferase, partial [candidate division KSB1 bacterium]|nr:glycosyltransferase [candidate division KSB1 bacterium]
MNWAELLFWTSGFLIFYTYLGYPALLRGMAIFISKRRQIDDQHRPSVSMLIAAYNEEAIIEEKLKNCLAIDYPKDKLEILIGSDGSQDRTNDI